MRALSGFILALLLAPSFAFAFPFGGQASTVVPCYNQAIFARLGAPRGGDYIWTPSTKTYQFGPPSFSGQWLLGLASAPYYCVVSIEPVIVWAGIAIDMMGSSGGSAGSIGRLLSSSPATTAAPPSPTPAPTLTPPATTPPPVTIGHVVISEIFYNVDSAHGTGPLNQWIEIYNGSTAAVDLSGWKLQNASTQTVLPSGTSLASAQFLFVEATSNTASFWTIPTTAKVISLNAASIDGGLAVSGDTLVLKDTGGTTVDSVSWGSNTSAFSPAVVSSLTGYSLARKTLAQDTNTVNDWAGSSIPTAGHY